MQTETQNTALKTEIQPTVITTATNTKPQRDAGLIAGTLIETAAGWRRAELLRVGDHVQTYDGGLRQLRRVERSYYGAGQGGYALEGILHVPGGAFDNCEEMFVMPDQMLMISSQVAADLLGTPSVLMPASALAGYRGITRVQPKGLIEAITLGFDDEEVVYANTGLLAHCASGASGATGAESDFFTTLDHGRAVALVSLLGQNRDVLDQAIATLNRNEPALLAAA